MMLCASAISVATLTVFSEIWNSETGGFDIKNVLEDLHQLYP